MSGGLGTDAVRATWESDADTALTAVGLGSGFAGFGLLPESGAALGTDLRVG